MSAREKAVAHGMAELTSSPEWKLAAEIAGQADLGALDKHLLKTSLAVADNSAKVTLGLTVDQYNRIVPTLVALLRLGLIAGAKSPEAVAIAKRVLSERNRAAGRRGGRVRHFSTAALKAWAIAQASTMRGADMDVARRLAALLPSHVGAG